MATVAKFYSSNSSSFLVPNLSRHHGSLPNPSDIVLPKSTRPAPGTVLFPRRRGSGFQQQPLDDPLHDRRWHQCTEPLSLLELAIWGRQDREMHPKEPGGREYNQPFVAGRLHLRRSAVPVHRKHTHQRRMAVYEKWRQHPMRQFRRV